MNDSQEMPKGFNQRNLSTTEQRDRLLAYLKYEEARRILATILIEQNAEKIEWKKAERTLAIVERTPGQESDVVIDDLGLRMSFVAPPDRNTKNESVYSVKLDIHDKEQYGVADPVTTYANGINDCADPRLKMRRTDGRGMVVGGFLGGQMPTVVLIEAVNRFQRAPQTELLVTTFQPSAPK